MSEPLDPRLLEILVCPKCKTEVRQVEDWLVCQSPGCGLRYPIREGIPVMLIEEAQSPPYPDATAAPAVGS